LVYSKRKILIFYILKTKEIKEIKWFYYSDVKIDSDGKNYNALLEVQERPVLIKNWEIINLIKTDKAYKLEFYYIFNNWNNFLLALKNKEWDLILIIDWNIINDFEYIDNIKFIPDNSCFIFIWYKNWKRFLVKNWKIEDKYTNVKKFVYSPNWKSFVFITGKDGKEILVRDWKEIREFDEIKKFMFLKNWDFILHVRKNWKDILFKNWQEIAKYDNIIEFLFSNNGWSYTIKYWDNWYYFLTKDGKIIKSWKEIYVYDIKYSFDWKDLFFILSENWKKFLMKNNDVILKCDYIYNIILAENQDSYITKVENRNKKYLLKDNKKININDDVYYYDLSSNWEKYIALIKENNKYHIDINWKKSNLYDNIKHLHYTKDLNNIFFIWKKNWIYHVVKNWKESEWYNLWEIQKVEISPDHKNYAILATKEDWTDVLIINWKEIKNYERIFNFALLFKRNEIIYFAKEYYKEDTLLQIREKIN